MKFEKNVYKDFYKEMTASKNNEGFFPYEYQAKVADYLLTGKNIILSVPTGAGKTWASIMPFLFAKNRSEIHFPQKLIYSLPLRSLCNSIFNDVTDALKNHDEFKDLAERQTGEFSNDKYFEKEIIFSTIDQTLSSFLCFPLALSHRQANINAGALIGSYLVFDEFHLLEPNLSMGTTLGTLKMLGNLSRFCIMTATLSSDFMNALKSNLTNYEIVTLDDVQFNEDKKKIKSLIPTVEKKTITITGQKISANQILEKHLDKTIVICNRVEVAQKMYRDIKTEIENYSDKYENLNLICLHSRFFDKDRKVKELQLKELLGKEVRNEKTNTILIATQVIEAGMDISCDTMHTEISPVNSLLQRVGRCARFECERGNIFVYDILDEQEKIELEIAEKEADKKEIRRINNRYLPYSPDLCKYTLATLIKFKTLDGDIPSKLIEEVLGEKEKEIIKQIEENDFYKSRIRESWLECRKNHYRSTIRDIQSVEITIVNDEVSKWIERYPFSRQSLSMYKWSLVSWLKKIESGQGVMECENEDWLIKILEENQMVGEVENDEEIEFQLTKLDNFKELPTQVFVNAKYFGYDPDFGFNWQYSATFNSISPRREKKETEKGFEPLEKDTFYQHNMGLVRCFEIDFFTKINFFSREIGKYIEHLEVNKNDIKRLITLMIILHDYGKLNKQWQAPMQRYQAFKEGIEPNKFKEILAHTDFDFESEDDKLLSIKAKLHERGGHSGVGAYVAQEIIPQILDNEYLTSGISMAIARHHGPLSNSYSDFSIPNINYTSIQRLLNKFELNDIVLEQEGFEDNLEGFQFEGHEEEVIYLFFVRILRLCDQKATENLKLYFNGK